MKKVLSILLCVMLVLSLGVICASAADSANVFVTIADKDGKLAVAVESVNVTDTDGDGALTINDALYCTHEAFYDGGAAAGYATRNTEYGLSLDKLWGTANGGSYGYYVNGASAWSLTDAVKDGDYLYAFVYTDLVRWSDKFSTFDQFKGDVDAEEGVALTLTYVAEYDASYMPVFKPLAGATILIDGEESGFVTDENGMATVTFDRNGTALVSAKSDSETITPPVFKANVTGAAEPTEPEDDGQTAEPEQEATEAATPDEATPDHASPVNTNAIQTGGAHAVVYVMLGMLVLALAIIVLKKKYEK